MNYFDLWTMPSRPFNHSLEPPPPENADILDDITTWSGPGRAAVSVGGFIGREVVLTSLPMFLDSSFVVDLFTPRVLDIIL
jgi:hypothetical protein